MAVIEYDEYKQKLLALEPALGELEKALLFAGQRSVDVRLILPHISDSFVAQALAKTYYRSLL